jgi:NAD(P)H dehydrogenase (quinone)
MKTIGVSGASGKLGGAVVAALKARAGAGTVIGISRTPEAVDAADQARLGDYDRPETLQSAYAGIDRLLLIPSSDLRPGVRGAQNTAAVDAAVAAGVGHIVLVSSAGTRQVQEPEIWASYYAGEQRLIRTAPAWTILRMNYYAEAFADEARGSLAHGAITGLSENRVGFVSRQDVAAAAAGILASDGHAGAIYQATGPASVSGAQRAALVAEVTGKPLGFLALPEEALRAGMGQAGLPQEIVEMVLSIQRGFAVGGFDIVTGDVEQLSGTPPRALADVLAAALADLR